MRHGRLQAWSAAGLRPAAETRPEGAAVTRPPEQAARLVEHAVVPLQPLPQIDPDTRPSGILRLRREGKASLLTGRIVGLRPGEHGLHIHEHGDCSTSEAPGGHFDPTDQR